MKRQVRQTLNDFNRHCLQKQEMNELVKIFKEDFSKKLEK